MDKGNAVFAILGGHALCCGLIVLGLGGGLAGALGWLVGDGLWALLTATFAVSALVLWRRSRAKAAAALDQRGRSAAARPASLRAGRDQVESLLDST